MGTFSSVFDNEPIDTSFLEEADAASDKLFGTFDRVFGQFDQLHDTIVTSAAINYKKLMLESMNNGASKDEFMFLEESNEGSLGQKLKTMLHKLHQMWNEFITKMRRVVTEKICNMELKSAIKKIEKRSITDRDYREHKIHFIARKDCLKHISKAIDGIDKTIAKILSKWRRSDNMKGATLKHRMRKYDRWVSDINKRYDCVATPKSILGDARRLQATITKVLNKENSEVVGLLTRAMTLSDTTGSASLRDELLNAVRERTELSKILCQHAIGILKDYTGTIIRDANHWNHGGRSEYKQAKYDDLQDKYNEVNLKYRQQKLKEQDMRLKRQNVALYGHYINTIDNHTAMRDQHRMNKMRMDYAQQNMYGFEESIDLSDLMEDEQDPQVQLEDAGLIKPSYTASSDDEQYLEEMNALFNDEFDY